MEVDIERPPIDWLTGILGDESFLSKLMQASMAIRDNFQARTARELTVQERKGRTSLAMVILLVRRTLKVRR